MKSHQAIPILVKRIDWLSQRIVNVESTGLPSRKYHEEVGAMRAACYWMGADMEEVSGAKRHAVKAVPNFEPSATISSLHKLARMEMAAGRPASAEAIDFAIATILALGGLA